MRSALRSGLATAVLLPVLALSAACSGGTGGGHSSGKGSPSGAPSGGAGGPAGSQPAQAEGTPLTAAQLRAALVTSADLPGYQVQGADGQPIATDDGLAADKAQCRPFADQVSGKPKYRRSAITQATVGRPEAVTSGGGLNVMLLSSYPAGVAEKVLGELKAALTSCSGFRGTDGKGKTQTFTVHKAAAVTAGDDAVAFVLSDTGGAQGAGSATVTVVRTGRNTATYVSVDYSGAQAALPPAIAVKQHDKLKAAQAKG